MTTKRAHDLYFDALDFVDGMNMTTTELIEIMREAHEYTEEEICWCVHQLLDGGHIQPAHNAE